MLVHYIKKPYVLKRMAYNYFGNIFELYVIHLHQRGYKPETIKQYCQSVEHFGRWLKNKKISPIYHHKAIANNFLKNHLSKCKCPTPRSTNCKIIVHYLTLC